MSDSPFDTTDAGAEPAGDDARRSGRRRAGGSGPARARGGFGDSGRGRGARRRDSGAAVEPDGVADPADDGMADPEAVARGICLRALTGAAKTRQQLAELLAGRDVPQDAADAVLDRFTEVGLIDDAAFAAAWVSSRQAGRGLSRRALASELRAKGVDGEVAAAAVAEVDPQDEWDTARKLVQRRAPAMRRLDRVTAERRLVGMLARKGYGGGLAGIVVREALDEVFPAALDAPDDELPDDGDTADGAPAGPARDPGFGSRSGTGSGGPGRSRLGGGGFGGGGFGGRKADRRAVEGKPDGRGLGGGGAGGIAGQRAASMADEVGEGLWEPIARPERPGPRRR